MPFKAILNGLMESVPGATGAILADWEGEAVVQQCHYDEFDLKVIGAHGGILLGLMKEVHGQSEAGGLRDVVIATEQLQIITGAVGRDYSLIMTLGRNALVGHALYRFRKAVVLLEKEIY